MRTLITVLLVCVLAPNSSARIEGVDVPQLSRSASVIVIVRVTHLEEPSSRNGEFRVATGEVLETWKGTTEPKVSFRASPDWACDLSDAVVGETAVVMLQRSSTGEFEITGSGRGRFPIETAAKGRRMAKVTSPDIRFPDGMSLPGLKPGETLVSIENLRDLVTNAELNGPSN